MHTLELNQTAYNRNFAETGEDPYLHQQSTPVFVEKQDILGDKILDDTENPGNKR